MKHVDEHDATGSLTSLSNHAVALVGRLPGPLQRVRVTSEGHEIEVVWAENPAGVRHDEGVHQLAGLPLEAAEESESGHDFVAITAPVVGVFYDSPSPDDEPFVSVGDEVRQGQQIAIVEAMKLMNPIVSTVHGEVVSVLVRAGESVEFAQPLIEIREMEG